MEGYDIITPVIKKISFEKKGYISFYLVDGRVVMCPVDRFPSIKKLNGDQRKKWKVMDEQQFKWYDCKEVFHLEQVLGREPIYYDYDLSIGLDGKFYDNAENPALIKKMEWLAKDDPTMGDPKVAAQFMNDMANGLIDQKTGEPISRNWKK